MGTKGRKCEGRGDGLAERCAGGVMMPLRESLIVNVDSPTFFVYLSERC